MPRFQSGRRLTYGKFQVRNFPKKPTQFEYKLREMNLTESTCLQSGVMKKWIEKNYTRLFIPESVISKLGLFMSEVILD
jgi:hypothetical protein